VLSYITGVAFPTNDDIIVTRIIPKVNHLFPIAGATEPHHSHHGEAPIGRYVECPRPAVKILRLRPVKEHVTFPKRSALREVCR
jgi:hypothetical protein